MTDFLARWKKKHQELSRLDILLALFFEFVRQGAKEASFPEMTESILKIQETTPIGYEFPEGLYYCHTLSEELHDLQFAGYLYYYEYRHDGFLPRSYFRLTALGEEKGRQLFGRLPSPLAQTLTASVAAAIERNATRWGMFARTKAKTKGPGLD